MADDSGLSGIGSIASAVGAYYGQERANKMNRQVARETNQQNLRMFHEGQIFSADQARKAMDFSERMSNTSWQRGVADMWKAGINPMLAVSQGGAQSASGVVGGSPSGSATTGAPMQSSLGSGISAAIQASSMFADVLNKKSQVELNKANAMASAQQAILLSNSAAKVNAETRRIKSEQPGKDVEEGIDKSTVGKILRWSNRVLDTAGSAFSLVNPFAQGMKLARGVTTTRQYDSNSGYSSYSSTHSR